MSAPPVQVRCALCERGVEEVAFDRGRVLAYCHGDLEEVPYAPGRARDGPQQLEAFRPNRLSFGGVLLTTDGVGGASSDGRCSCETPGCRVDGRRPGCPRYARRPSER